MAEENEKEIPATAASHIDNIFETLLKRYRPAADFQDADLRMSTNEIYDHLQELCPGETFKANQVYEKMIENNFKLDELGDTMQFVWLLKKK